MPYSTLLALANACAPSAGASTSTAKDVAASTSSTVYYSGSAKTTMPQANGDVNEFSHPYLVERVTDETNGTITEHIVSYDPQSNKFKENASVMTIHGNDFTMTESTGTVTGGGTFTGKPWKWTYLKGEFHATYDGQQMKIDDVNFFAATGMLMGHKDIEFPVGNLFLQEDVALTAVDEATCSATKAQLLGQ